MFNVKKFSQTDTIVWNEFVTNSKNHHFFFYRKYMDYHAHKFADHSLLIYDDTDSLVALLPANLCEEVLYSHQGLTFGGLLVKSSLKQSTMMNVFSALIDYLKSNNFKKFVYKRIPPIYHSMPSDEDLYALFINEFKLTRRDVSSTIDLRNQISYSKGRKWLVNKAKKEAFELIEDEDIHSFWSALESVLYKQHGVKPVHSEAEIKYLQSSFPKNIITFSVRYDNETIAGAVLFVSGDTVHTQYLFNTDDGRRLGALDFLIDYLVKNKYASYKYFDFGISNENQGRYLNEGLVAQKEGFGARAICHEFYEITL